jgi:hypothetical protein
MSGSMEISPTGWTAIAGVLVAGVTGFFSWIGGRHSSVAVLQKALTEGFKELNDLQTAKMAHMQTEINELRGQVRGLEQRNLSLRQILRSNGIDVPRDTVHVPVFTPYPDPPVEATHGDIFDITCETDK